MNSIQRWMLVAVVVCLGGAARANNLTITNVALVNVSGGMADIQFDVSWSNSWRYNESAGGGVITNHDAAWIFIKFRGGGDWHHAMLTDTGHFAPAGAEIKVSSNGGSTNVGVFLLRSSDGYGGLEASGVRLHWDYVAAGLTGTNGVDISVHGTEMVYIPEGPFYVGSGGEEQGGFYRYPSSTTPFLITNEAAIAVGSVTGNLFYSAGGTKGDALGPIPAEFPKGYAAFYCMKYEISQGQYAQFLNRLPSGSDGVYYPNSYGNIRHTINLVSGVYTADAPDRACNYLSWSDVAGFCDWAGMRPMSELEFEKVCRGPLVPVPNEYAWGDTTAVNATGTNGVDGSGTETLSPVTANYHANQTQFGLPALWGPVRVGVFATASSSRHQAGAGYHGVMELSGNVFERAVSAGNPAGRAFVPTPGDGDTQTANPGWPDVVGVTAAEGVGRRGGAFGQTQYPQTSERPWSILTQSIRDQFSGGRGVRSDP